MDELKKALAQERFNKEFNDYFRNGKNDKFVKQEEPEENFQEEEEVIREMPSSSKQRFIDAEKDARMNTLRVMIQKQVDSRMKQIGKEQFDIDWNDDGKEEDIDGWIDTLSKYGRNTKEIQTEYDLIRGKDD